jgi:hypothetical protein
MADPRAWPLVEMMQAAHASGDAITGAFDRLRG